MQFLALLIPFLFVYSVYYAIRRARRGSRRERALWVLAVVVAIASGLPAAFDDNAGVHWAWWMTSVFTEITVAVMLVEAMRERYAETRRS